MFPIGQWYQGFACCIRWNLINWHIFDTSVVCQHDYVICLVRYCSNTLTHDILTNWCESHLFIVWNLICIHLNEISMIINQTYFITWYRCYIRREMFWILGFCKYDRTVNKYLNDTDVYPIIVTVHIDDLRTTRISILILDCLNLIDYYITNLFWIINHVTDIFDFFREFLDILDSLFSFISIQFTEFEILHIVCLWWWYLVCLTNLISINKSLYQFGFFMCTEYIDCLIDILFR